MISKRKLMFHLFYAPLLALFLSILVFIFAYIYAKLIT